MSSMLIFKAYIYDFLLDGVVGLSLFDVAGLGKEVDLEALVSKLKAVDSIYFHFYFDLFFIFQFLELRVRVRVMRSHCHTSDDMVTGHMIHGRT